MGKPNVLFCVFFSGNSYDINNWYFDDIEAYTMENFDLGISTINLPSVIPFSGLNVSMQVFNYGVTPITSVEAEYEIAGQAPVVEMFSVDLPSLEKEDLQFTTPVNVMPGNYDVTVRVRLVNGTEDDNPDNDVVTKNITVAVGSADRFVMIENFSSSTCGPCVQSNAILQELCTANPGVWTFAKFSTTGDAYCTSECQTRSSYYNVLGVPQDYLDGENQGFDPVTAASFAEHHGRPAFMDIRGSFALNGSQISVKADIMPYIDEEATVFISVNEKVTEGNVGFNGETQFFHVMMKMLPNANGIPTSFVAGEAQYFEYEYDMSSTHIEEMTDLEVAIWVQKDTREVLNSRFAYEYTDLHPYPVENLTLTDEVNRGNLLAAWDAPAQGSPLGYNVFVNGALAVENTTESTYAFPAVADKYNVVEVQAVYPDGLTSVKQVAGLMNYDAVTEQEAYSCRVFPNPANTQVCIEAESDINVVKVYDVLGNLVQTFSANGNALNVSLSRFSNGVYLFNVVESNGKVSCQRVVVTH